MTGKSPFLHKGAGSDCEEEGRCDREGTECVAGVPQVMARCPGRGAPGGASEYSFYLIQAAVEKRLSLPFGFRRRTVRRMRLAVHPCHASPDIYAESSAEAKAIRDLPVPWRCII